MYNQTKCDAYKPIDDEIKEAKNCRNCAFFSSVSCVRDAPSETSSLIDFYL
jgi:hypothetical protein